MAEETTRRAPRVPPGPTSLAAAAATACRFTLGEISAFDISPRAAQKAVLEQAFCLASVMEAGWRDAAAIVDRRDDSEVVSITPGIHGGAIEALRTLIAFAAFFGDHDQQEQG